MSDRPTAERLGRSDATRCPRCGTDNGDPTLDHGPARSHRQHCKGQDCDALLIWYGDLSVLTGAWLIDKQRETQRRRSSASP